MEGFVAHLDAGGDGASEVIVVVIEPIKGDAGSCIDNEGG